MIPKSKRGTLVSLLTMKVQDGMIYQVGFVVSRGRKYGHLTAVKRQTAAMNNAKLSRYGQSLFDSCFKNW